VIQNLKEKKKHLKYDFVGKYFPPMLAIKNNCELGWGLAWEKRVVFHHGKIVFFHCIK